MDHSPQRHPLINDSSLQRHRRHPLSPSKTTDMAMLAATPAPHTGFQKEYPWDSAPSRFPTYYASSSQTNQARISLPSIRNHFPELESCVPAHPHSSHTSPASTSHGRLTTSPSYVPSHSPVSHHKRRRDSLDDDAERERARQVPRMYHGHHSPEQHHAPLTARSSPSSAPYSRAPAPIEVSEARPSGPALLPPTRSTEAPAYQQHSHHHASAAAPPPPMATAEYSPRYTAPPPPPPSYDYSYRQPSHHAYDRTPFTGTTTAVSTPAGYTRGGSVSAGSSVSYATAPGAEYARYPDLGHLGMGGDSKQRKRRGNLPKETTDKLRSWFMAHLSHPYPTEDEKQDLMRQTGLQMNQISNWFINARRRQLPTMISNARIESDAISSARDTPKMMASTERPDYPHHHHSHSHSHSLVHPRSQAALSDGEGAPYEDELERRRGPAMDRGSV